MVSEYDLIMISMGRRKERTVQCCSTLFAFIAVVVAIIMRFDYESHYFNSKSPFSRYLKVANFD